MTKAPTLLRTTGALGASSVFVRVCNLLVVAILARAVGSSAVGLYGVATLSASLVALVSSLGLATYATRQFSAGSISDDEVRAIHIARGFLLLLGAGVIAIGAVSFAGTHVVLGVVGFASAAMFDQWNESAWALVRGTKRAPVEAWTNAWTNGAAVMVGLALFAVHRLSFASYGLCVLGTAVIRAVCASLRTGALRTPLPRRPISPLPGHVRDALPYLASDVLGVAYLRGDTLLLSLFAATNEVGYYVAAATLVAPLVQVGASMSAGALATASRQFRTGEDNEVGVVSFFALSGYLAAFLLVACLPLAIYVIYGRSEPSVLGLSVVLALFVPLRFLNFALSSLALARGWATQRLGVVAFATVLNVVLNLVLDPTFKGAGAAWSTVITEIGISAAFLHILGWSRLWLAAVGVLGVVVLGGAAVSLQASHDVATAAVAVLLGVATAVSFGGLRHRERASRVSVP